MITVKGKEKVFNNLNKIVNKIESILDNEAKKLIVSIVADGQRGAPVDTGFLRANIKSVVRKDKYAAVSNANYSLPVDKRKPFFQLQANKKIGKFIAKLKSKLSRL